MATVEELEALVHALRKENLELEGFRRSWKTREQRFNRTVNRLEKRVSEEKEKTKAAYAAEDEARAAEERAEEALAKGEVPPHVSEELRRLETENTGLRNNVAVLQEELSEMRKKWQTEQGQAVAAEEQMEATEEELAEAKVALRKAERMLQVLVKQSCESTLQIGKGEPDAKA